MKQTLLVLLLCLTCFSITHDELLQWIIDCRYYRLHNPDLGDITTVTRNKKSEQDEIPTLEEFRTKTQEIVQNREIEATLYEHAQNNRERSALLFYFSLGEPSTQFLQRLVKARYEKESNSVQDTLFAIAMKRHSKRVLLEIEKQCQENIKNLSQYNDRVDFLKGVIKLNNDEALSLLLLQAERRKPVEKTPVIERVPVKTVMNKNSATEKADTGVTVTTKEMLLAMSNGTRIEYLLKQIPAMHNLAQKRDMQNLLATSLCDYYGDWLALLKKHNFTSPEDVNELVTQFFSKSMRSVSRKGFHKNYCTIYINLGDSYITKKEEIFSRIVKETDPAFFSPKALQTIEALFKVMPIPHSYTKYHYDTTTVNSWRQWVKSLKTNSTLDKERCRVFMLNLKMSDTEIYDKCQDLNNAVYNNHLIDTLLWKNYNFDTAFVVSIANRAEKYTRDVYLKLWNACQHKTSATLSQAVIKSIRRVPFDWRIRNINSFGTLIRKNKSFEQKLSTELLNLAKQKGSCARDLFLYRLFTLQMQVTEENVQALLSVVPKLSPDDEWYLNAIVWVLVERKDMDTKKAATIYRNALEKMPDKISQNKKLQSFYKRIYNHTPFCFSC